MLFCGRTGKPESTELRAERLEQPRKCSEQFGRLEHVVDDEIYVAVFLVKTDGVRQGLVEIADASLVLKPKQMDGPELVPVKQATWQSFGLAPTPP